MTLGVGTARNQPPPLEGYDLFAENRPLIEALRREGGGAWEERASALGTELGGEPLEWGRLANVNRLIVGKKALVTPLVKDELRNRKITLEYADQ